MTIASSLKEFRGYAFSVIDKRKTQTRGFVAKFDFDEISCRMPERIHQSLATDPISFIADGRVQPSAPALNQNPKVDLLRNGKFLSDPRKSEFKIVTVRVRGSQTLHYIPPLLTNNIHQFQNSTDKRLCRGIRRQDLIRNVQVHGGAQETLQQSVVEILRNSRTFGQAFFEAKVQLLGNVTHTPAIHANRDDEQSEGDAQAKPQCLPVLGFDDNRYRGF
jgi:hypothetical protein